MIGMLIRKTDPQWKCSSSRPPMMGPMAGPPANPAVQMPMAVRRWSSSVNMTRIMARTEGSRAAPPTPKMTRPVISISGVVESAETRDATPKRRAPIISSRRRPMRSPMLPMATRSPARTKPQMSMIQSSWVPVGARSAVIHGRAMNRTDRSMDTSSVATNRTPRPTHSRPVARLAALLATRPVSWPRGGPVDRLEDVVEEGDEGGVLVFIRTIIRMFHTCV